jgi:prolyl-tRNA synthetase
MLNWSLSPMRWSRLFIPTLRESPVEAEGASQRLLLRAGYARQVAGGTYAYLFLGQRALTNIARIAREEMDSIGGQEMLLPREAQMAALARGDLRSYRQLPQTWYQIKTGAGHSIELESRSFDMDAAGLDISYRQHDAAYRRIFDRCGLTYRVVDGGSESRDFMVECETGADCIVTCRTCGHAANRRKATARAAAPRAPDPEGDLAPEEFHTPGRKTIADVSEFTRLPESSQIKSLVMAAKGKLLLVLVRGDHQLSETKFAAVAGDPDFRPARPEEIRAAFGADAGSLGPVGVTRLTILADNALQGRRNMIAGANKDDYHLRHVTPGEDFQAEFHDLREVQAGDGCIACGAPLEFRGAIGIGHLLKLEPGCAESIGLHVSNASGQEAAPMMGTYGIAIERILSAAIELSHDQDGMILPPSIAPFTVTITPVHMAEPAQKKAAEEIYAECRTLGLDALLDDRDERPGVKFKDADLIGAPFRITVGKKIAGGTVELVERRARKAVDVPAGEAAAAVAARARGEQSGT